MKVTAKWTTAGLTRGRKYIVTGIYKQWLKVIIDDGSEQIRHKGAFEKPEL